MSTLQKTLELRDLQEPRTRATARALSRFLRGLFLRGEPVAVNGVLHRRFYVRRFKMWEYARGLAYSDPREAREVLDFGGAATLPAYYLAARGSRVRVLDIDASLVERSRRAAARRGWELEASTLDITEQELPEGWGPFDRIYSFCVIEHMSRAAYRAALTRLAERLAPGGRLVLSFEYGDEAPGEGALRSCAEVEELVEFTGLAWSGPGGFQDSGDRFRMDRRHPDRRFTFGSLFLEKVAGQ